MALYMEFNKGGVEEIIDDPLILSLNEIIQKNSMKGQTSESPLDLARNMRGTFVKVCN
jgi:hypothetical protein